MNHCWIQIFDITDGDVVTNELSKIVSVLGSISFQLAEKKLMGTLNQLEKVSPMKRAQLAETNTVITLTCGTNGSGTIRFNIVYRGKHACFPHISFTWSDARANKPVFQKGRFNLVEYKNKRKGPNIDCWILPANSFNTLYGATPNSF